MDASGRPIEIQHTSSNDDANEAFTEKVVTFYLLTSPNGIAFILASTTIITASPLHPSLPTHQIFASDKN